MQQSLDAIIVGAGMAGIYAVYHLRRLGLSVRLFEAGSSVGGTWYWNRYPGARVDIESMEYSYAFSEELQQEWEWSERYAGQAELARYFEFVTDRFDLRRHMQFDTRVDAARYDEAADEWVVETSDGGTHRARFCVMTTGLLSAPNKPDIPGLESFAGAVYHTGLWPKEKVDFTGQRVGVVGTGSSAVQAIPLIAAEAAHLTVFQRTPAYAVPLRNHPMPDEYQRKVKADYAEWRRKERHESFGGWVAVHYAPVEPVATLALDATPEARQALYEDRWRNGGLALYNVYPDVYVNREANETLAEFVRGKIRERVQDPATAALLTPDYPILMKRLIADTNYYETYNRDNVSLVDVSRQPVERITPGGVMVGGQEYACDSLVLATGYDAMTGALTRMHIEGRNGAMITGHWAQRARTYLGLMCAGFPNFFIIDAVGSPSVVFQPVFVAEEQINWVGDCIRQLHASGRRCIEAAASAEDAWGEECERALQATLFPTVNSWYVGANIAGKSHMGLIYLGGMAEYRRWMNDEAAHAYPGFVFDGGRGAQASAAPVPQEAVRSAG
jgi:cyclohexanone monooxygenase